MPVAEQMNLRSCVERLRTARTTSPDPPLAPLAKGGRSHATTRAGRRVGQARANSRCVRANRHWCWLHAVKEPDDFMRATTHRRLGLLDAPYTTSPRRH